MGNIIGLVLIGVAIGFALFVIFKLIKAGIDDSNNAGDDDEQKQYPESGDDLPYPKNYEK